MELNSATPQRAKSRNLRSKGCLTFVIKVKGLDGVAGGKGFESPGKRHEMNALRHQGKPFWGKSHAIALGEPLF